MIVRLSSSPSFSAGFAVQIVLIYDIVVDAEPELTTAFIQTIELQPDQRAGFDDFDRLFTEPQGREYAVERARDLEQLVTSLSVTCTPEHYAVADGTLITLCVDTGPGAVQLAYNTHPPHGWHGVSEIEHHITEAYELYGR